MSTRYPWPIPPFTTAWHLTTLIPLHASDQTTITWMLTQYPGGPPQSSDYMDLMMTWVDQAVFATNIPDAFGWWFFLSILGNHQLWKQFWKIQMRGVVIEEIQCNLIVPAQPCDRLWLQYPMTLAQWIDKIQTADLPTDPDLRQKILRLAVWMGWRLAFWQQWRERQNELTWHVTPIVGLDVPHINRAPEMRWIRQHFLSSFNTKKLPRIHLM